MLDTKNGKEVKTEKVSISFYPSKQQVLAIGTKKEEKPPKKEEADSSTNDSNKDEGNNEENNNNNNNSNSSNKNSGKVQTGDRNNLVFPLIGMTAAILAVATVLIIRKKKRL